MAESSKLAALEAECSRNLTSTKCWMTFARATISAQSTFSDKVAWANAVNVVFERATRAVPYSYKLWWHYLQFRLGETPSLCSPNEWFQGVRQVYERALEKLPRMPMLWCAFLRFVQAAPSPRISMMRHLIARALEALPATQHHHIWKIATNWARGAHVPFLTFRSIWRSYLLFKPSIETQRQYFALLAQRGDSAELLEECVAFVRTQRSLGATNAETAHPDDDGGAASAQVAAGLEKSAEFWETIQEVFQSPNWVYAGDPRELDELVDTGCHYAASPVDFEAAYAVCLYGQGRVLDGRTRLRRLLDTAPDPDSFMRTYRMMIEVEDQLLESFALSSELHQASDTIYREAEATLFGEGNAPADELKHLAEQFPLWLNQCQLRVQPTNVALWLKRLELVEERVYTGACTTSDCMELCQQAIAQCTAGLDTVDCAVGELYEQLARLLVHAGKPAEAAAQLSTAAWHVRFASPFVNMMLLGRLVELKLAFTSATPLDTLTYLMERLTAKLPASTTSAIIGLAGPTAVQRRRKDGFITTSKEAPLAHVQSSTLAWLLAVDVALSYAPVTTVSHTLDTFTRSSSYTAEAACYVGYALLSCGESRLACAEMERAVARFHDHPVALTLVLSQYLSMLSLLYGRDMPLHRFRELTRVAQDAAPSSLEESPVMAVELITACAAVEAERGLYGHALDILLQLCHLVVRHVDIARYEQLVEGTVEMTIRATKQFKGMVAMREVCAKLLKNTPSSSLGQRIALQWAGIERATGDMTRAHQILDACADSQDPRTTHGAVYWRLWEAMCTEMKQLEEVARRRQQVVTAYQKRG